MFNQISAWEEINIYGERVVAGILKEYIKLYHMSVLSKLNPDKFLIEDKKQALHMITLIKEKKCGNIKGRTCADVRTQRQYI